MKGWFFGLFCCGVLTNAFIPRLTLLPPKVIRLFSLSNAQTVLQRHQEHFSGRVWNFPFDEPEENPSLLVNDDGDSLISAIEKYSNKTTEQGMIASGYVIHVDRGNALVEIGWKSPAYIPLSEASFSKISNMHDSFYVQQHIKAVVVGWYKGMPVLSPRMTDLREIWKVMKEQQRNGSVLDVRLVSFNRGGALGDLNGISVFLPYSQGLRGLGPHMIGNTVKVCSCCWLVQNCKYSSPFLC
jgi:hypothetical protein